MSGPRMNEQTTRLTETLPELKRRPDCCGLCGHLEYETKSGRLEFWQECNHDDQPEPRWLVLCHDCANKIIDAHPRLYHRCDPNSPMPGVMLICRKCPNRTGWKCTKAKSNGGPGIVVKAAPAQRGFVDGTKNGRRFGFMFTRYEWAPTDCTGLPQ